MTSASPHSPRRLLSLALTALALSLAGCAGPVSPARFEPPVQVVDSFVFQIQDRSLRPIGNARIAVTVEAGYPLVSPPLHTDESGRAVLPMRAAVAPQVVGRRVDDRLVAYRSVIDYLVTAPGYLPVSGRSSLTDAWDAFTKATYASMLDRRPENKLRRLDLSLIGEDEVFRPDALQDPLARTVRAGLNRTWLKWLTSGRRGLVAILPESWGVWRRDDGPYLQAGLEVLAPLGSDDDQEIYDGYVLHFIPLLNDLAAAYAPLVAGWDFTIQFQVRPGADPHAMGRILPLRIVFSEARRRELLGRPEGLKGLLLKAETRTLAGREWNPLENMEREQAAKDFILRAAGPFLAPGPGPLPEKPRPVSTSASSQPAESETSSGDSPAPRDRRGPEPPRP